VEAQEEAVLLTQNVLLQHSADHLQTDALQLLGDLQQQRLRAMRVSSTRDSFKMEQTAYFHLYKMLQQPDVRDNCFVYTFQQHRWA